MATNISASVGKGGSNQFSDVVLVQLLLNNHIGFDSRLTGKVQPLVANGKIEGSSSDDPTVKAVKAFQKHVMGFSSPDGRVDPITKPSDSSSGKTFRALCGPIGVPIPNPNKERLEFRIASISWVNKHPNPVRLAAQAELLDPEWVPKTYMGLVATSNSRPPDEISDFRAYEDDGDFRALMYFKVRVILEGKFPQQKVAKVELVDKILDPGWTPPFRTREFPMTWFAFDPDIDSTVWHKGEMSPRSSVVTEKLHPNSALSIPADEIVVASGLIKFRAGSHTDNIGVGKINCPFHVPWVWCETALTYDGEHFKIHGRGSLFPSHTWYKNDKQLSTRAQVGDESLPLSGRTINLAALKIYTVFNKGAPASGPQTAAGSDASSGPVSTHHNTVSGGEPKLHGQFP
jgi:hypothetical protein